ncbi:MAG: hypothetical protein AMJ90_10060 [candidate division Zixibacteria bacterium SM23_73_2]|nr:MAG: hypothetical protein AMJ90_10060 [candidate division Zixibacteria bacterium SM23_73_2]
MRGPNWQITLGIILIALSALVYLFHYFIFRDPHHIFIYLIGDIAFVFFEVLLVTLVIHQLLNQREKRIRLEKLNMVIGAFFSEVGIKFLTYLSDFDPGLDKIREELIVTKDWPDQEFSSVSRKLKDYDYRVEIGKLNLKDLRIFLLGKRDFLLRLLENPNILEHETFTELLRAVFHLTEELGQREDIDRLPDTDVEHLAGDIKRVYLQLVHQWLDYMRHLKDSYPYLFSLAMRTNPFDQESSPIVK